MKTKLICMILSCIMLASLTACANDKLGTSPDETTKETDVQTTENVTTEDTTEDTAEAGLAFNEDLLSDIGRTYPELVEKRGERKITELITCELGIGYFFENGYGAYVWGYDDLNYGRELVEGEGYPVPRDENHNIIAEKVQLPKSDIKCECITFAEAKDLLLNVSYPLNVSNIEGIEEIEDVRTGEDGGYVTSYKYYFNFKYENFEISIFHDDTDIIEADSEVRIYMLTN